MAGLVAVLCRFWGAGQVLRCTRWSGSPHPSGHLCSGGEAPPPHRSVGAAADRRGPVAGRSTVTRPTPPTPEGGEPIPEV